MYAIVEIQGHQYKVEEGAVVEHELIRGVQPGERVIFDRVLLLRNGEGIEIGRPYVERVQVVGEVEAVGKRPKVLIQRFRPKKGYRRLRGHRQPFMRTRIVSIERA
jgi:large subunit ribosomal protein L21